MSKTNEDLNCTDEEILLGLVTARHEHQAVQCLIKRLYPVVRAHVLQNSGTANDAREVFSISLTVLMEKVRTGQYRREAPLGAFVFAVARHKWADVLRQRKKDRGLAEAMAAIPAEVEDWDPLDTDEPDNERQQLAARCFEALGTACRRVLELFYLEKKTMREIAKAMGYSGEDTAKAMKHKCLRQLQNMVNGDEKK